MNYLRTAVLLAAMTGLFLVIGFMLGGQTGMIIALLFAAGTNVYAYWNSDKAVLSMHGAEPASEARNPLVTACRARFISLSVSNCRVISYRIRIRPVNCRPGSKTGTASTRNSRSSAPGTTK